MSTANLDAADLAGVSFGGLINEDVMQEVWDISRIPTPLADMIGTTPVDNAYFQWTTDELAAPDTNNATVDGADASGNDAQTGARVGNHCQYPDKVVKVSNRANNSNTIGFSNTLEYQVMQRQRELRRDVDAIALVPQASVADDGDSIAGRMGGLPSWLVTNTNRGATGSDGGFSNGTVAAPGFGTIRPISETAVRDVAQSCYVNGSDPTILMSVPDVIRRLSEYMFTADAQIANLRRNEQGDGAAKAVGSVNVFITDFGVTMEFVPNRLQQLYNSNTAADALIIDPAHLMFGYLQGYRVEELAKNGTADNRQMTVDVTIVPTTEKAHGVIADIDPTAAAVA